MNPNYHIRPVDGGDGRSKGFGVFVEGPGDELYPAHFPERFYTRYEDACEAIAGLELEDIEAESAARIK